MVSLDLSPERVLDRQYAESSADPGFGEILAIHAPRTEDDLADLIELDGRKRIGLERPIELRRYLDAIPELTDWPVALDAAIDVTLRSISGGRRPDADAVRSLCGDYPRLERAIRDAALLGRSMLSTSDVHRSLRPDLPGELPADFGPAMRDGAARYQLQACLGAGAYGEVYRAVDRQLSEADRPALVAIKLMRFREGSPWARQRFVEEATKARRITHPNVARVLDRGIADGDADYIVYEYIAGGDLQAWVGHGDAPTAPEEAAALVARIARAVHAAHTAGLVHCDMKPGNILLTPAGEPKVTDFGIAVRTVESGTAVGRSPDDRPLGNLAFTSPEQYRMEDGAMASPADIYAVGGILYYLLTGKYPNGQSPEEIRVNLDRAPAAGAPSPRALRPEVDRDLDSVCRRALAPTPDGRHGSAAELAADLEAWLRREPISWTRPSRARVVRLWTRRRPLVAALSVVLAGAILGGVGVAFHLSGVAAEARVTARLADEKIAKSRSQIAQFYGMVSLMNSDRIVQDLLPTIMVLEWIEGGTVLGPPGQRTKAWADRVRIVSDLVADAEKSGRGATLETLIWRYALAFWLVSDGRCDEAAPMIEADLVRWSSMLAPDDPWLAQIRAIGACASVQKLRNIGVAPDLADGSPVRAAEADLLAAEKLFRGKTAGTPVHQLILRTLADLYGPGLLDTPKQVERFSKRLELVAG